MKLPQLPLFLKKPLAILKRIGTHHYFISLLVILGGLATTVYFVNETLNAPTDDTYRADLLKKTVGTQFNKTTQDTIAKIEALQRSDQGGQATLPSGRINPFAE